MLSTEDSLSGSMARSAAHSIRRLEIRGGMGLSDAAEKARSRTSVSNLQPHFRRLRLICPTFSPFFREIPVQKAGGFLPEFPTTERGRSPLEWFLRWYFTARMSGFFPQ